MFDPLEERIEAFHILQTLSRPKFVLDLLRGISDVLKFGTLKVPRVPWSDNTLEAFESLTNGVARLL